MSKDAESQRDLLLRLTWVSGLNFLTVCVLVEGGWEYTHDANGKPTWTKEN